MSYTYSAIALVKFVWPLALTLLTSAASNQTCTGNDDLDNLLQVGLSTHLAKDGPAPTPKVKGQVWQLCRGQVAQAPSQQAKAAGMKSVNMMRCTKQMSFKELCCAPWMTALKYEFTAALELDSDQDSHKSAALMQEESNRTRIKVLTQAVPGMELAPPGSGAVIPTECIQKDFTEDELKGNTSYKGHKWMPGEIVLAARALYFMNKEIPRDAIPSCKTQFAWCDDAQTVKPAVIAAAGEKLIDDWQKAQEKPESLVEQRESSVAVDGGNSVFAGALLTSGSFTMMASTSY